jgi:hypothetical protein
VDLAHLIVDGIQPEALVICGTNIPALEMQKNIRAVVPCPVITTNQAILEQFVKSGY